jgi:thioredoxin-like negative regulator of GroEL
MDTVTYPDPEVGELLARFVCIRLDHDREPALVQQHGVKALPDLRLLDPDGRELHRLIGLSSPTRLVEHARAALERLAGRTAAAASRPASVAARGAASPSAAASPASKTRCCAHGRRRASTTRTPRSWPAA